MRTSILIVGILLTSIANDAFAQVKTGVINKLSASTQTSTVASKANEGPDAGLAAGKELLELYRARVKQLEPIANVESLEGYAEVVAPILDRIYQMMPKFHFALTRSLEAKTWYFVGSGLRLDPNSGLDKDIRDLRRVGRQSDAMVELLKPWFYDHEVNTESRGGIIIHEMVVGAARQSYNRSTGRPSPTDVETLVTVLLKDPQITFKKLQNLMVELGFEREEQNSATPLSHIVNEALRSQYGFRNITLARDNQQREFFVVHYPTLKGEPIYYDSGYTSLNSRLETICERLFTFNFLNRSNAMYSTYGPPSRPVTWTLGVEEPYVRSGHSFHKRVIESVRCTRAPYYQIAIDMNLGPVELVSP